MTSAHAPSALARAAAAIAAMLNAGGARASARLGDDGLTVTVPGRRDRGAPGVPGAKLARKAREGRLGRAPRGY